jgi:hypothetical protein
LQRRRRIDDREIEQRADLGERLLPRGVHLAVRACSPMEPTPPVAARRTPTRRERTRVALAIPGPARHGLGRRHGLKV